MNTFFRFPHTPHIAWLGMGMPRGDKLLSLKEIEELLSGEVIIEEKIDGANIGFSLGEKGELQVQNRGAYLEQPYRGQFSRLNGWLGQCAYLMKPNLTENLIVFGEWCAARHSLQYSYLPDFFLLFDIYDKAEGKFWSVSRRNDWSQKVGIHTVPHIDTGHYSSDSLQNLLHTVKSAYREGRPEGIVIRKDDTLWNQARGKLVRSEFVQTIATHWSSRQIEWNGLDALHNSSSNTL